MIFKQSVIWNRVTETLPEEGREYLVWTGKTMIVSYPYFNDPDMLADALQSVKDGFLGAKYFEDLKNSKGHFMEFGSKYYFDDPKVHWSELPLAPGEKNPPPPDPMEGIASKDAYFKKDGSIIGIHAIGYPGPYEYDLHGIDGSVTRMKSDFQQLEIWGNEYDDEHNVLGRGSFRVFNEYNQVVKDLIEEG